LVTAQDLVTAQGLGVARGKVGARAPGRRPWGCISTLFTVIEKCILSKNIDHSLLKNAYSLKKKNAK